MSERMKKFNLIFDEIKQEVNISLFDETTKKLHVLNKEEKQDFGQKIMKSDGAEATRTSL